MGSLSNNSRKLANFAGFYKGIQSVGQAVTWRYVIHFPFSSTCADRNDRMDALETPYMNEFASCWGILVGSLLIAVPVIFKVKDTTDVEEDLKFSDETMQEVAPEQGK
jgi:hypothetical protein